jgi:acetyl-CoA carboxylase carboxyl transferase subunit alpha
MSRLKVPIVSICIGEGGSGGALGISVGDRLAMLEFAYYSVISPEGCAAILWRDGSQAADAAQALKLTSTDLLKLGLIDAVIPEPVGGAHRNVHDVVHSVERYTVKTLADLKRTKMENLLENRYKKWRSLGTSVAISTRGQPRPAKARVKAVPKVASAKARPTPAKV